MKNLFAPIFNTTTNQLKKTASVTLNASQKWKSGSSVPSLHNAALIEEQHNVPIKLWINYEKFIADLKDDGKYNEFKKVVRNSNYEDFMKSLELDDKYKVYFEE